MLLLSDIWGMWVGKGLQRLSSDRIIRKRQPRTACEPRGPPAEFVLVITVDQNVKNVCRGTSRMCPGHAFLRCTNENTVPFFPATIYKPCHACLSIVRLRFPRDFWIGICFFETHARIPLSWQLTHCTACTSSAPCDLRYVHLVIICCRSVHVRVLAESG